MIKLTISERALEDIEECLIWSAANFGRAAALRYRELLAVALSELADDPGLLGSRVHAGLQAGVRLYHLAHSRRRAPVEGLVVKRPRHFIVYRVAEGDSLEVLRVLDDRMDLEHQLLDFLS